MAAEEQQADTSSASRLHPENSQADAAQQKHMNEHPSLAAPAPVLMLEYKMGCPEQAAAITPDQQQHLKAEREEAQPASPSYQLQLSLDFSEPEADMTEQKSYQPTSFQPLSRHLQASLAPSDSCLAASHQPALPPITYPGHESSDGAGPLPEPACVRQPSGASIQGQQPMPSGIDADILSCHHRCSLQCHTPWTLCMCAGTGSHMLPEICQSDCAGSE